MSKIDAQKGDLLVEFFSEEIPARLQVGSGEQLENLFVKKLVSKEVSFDSCKTYTGPRHLAIIIREIDLVQKDQLVEKRGPRLGSDEKAINGFDTELNRQLTPEEQEAIKTATDGYNATIEALASAKGLAMVDFKTLLVNAASNGYVFDDFTMTTSLVTGGMISLDGVHLTARGYAMMANEILDAIDLTYGSNFAEATDGKVKANDYPTNYSPSLQ